MMPERTITDSAIPPASGGTIAAPPAPIITPMVGAAMISADYAGRGGAPILNIDGITASYAGNILIIRGTDDRGDWLANLRFAPWPSNIATGASKRWWHRGFLARARVVYALALRDPPAMILGHSLGAAVAQIVGGSLKIPTMAFASPRPLFLSSQPDDALDTVHSWCRTDDPVCGVPPDWLGYRHVGRVTWLHPERDLPGWAGHGIARYLEML